MERQRDGDRRRRWEEGRSHVSAGVFGLGSSSLSRSLLAEIRPTGKSVELIIRWWYGRNVGIMY